MDYQKIIDNLKIESIINLMKKMGAEDYIEKETYIIFPTICHNTDAAEASMKLYFYKDTKLFVCYTEDGNMSIFKFLKTYYESRQIEYDWYRDIYKIIMSCCALTPFEVFSQKPVYENLRTRYATRKNREALKEIPKSILNIYNTFYSPEWLNNGITKEAMDKYGILFSMAENKIIIPHWDVNNRLVGIRGRALNEWEIENIGKYMPVQIESKWYSHPLSLNLYGLNMNKENIKRFGLCYLFEAEKSVLQVESFSTPNCAVATCGSNFNKYALDLLIKTCAPKEIIICYDKEEEKGSDKYFNKLYQLGKKYSNYSNFSFLYDRENLLKNKESPSDRGEEVFQKLIKKRIKIL